MSIVPICRSTSQACRRTCWLNTIQKRSNFYNKYKHGPTRASNPKPDYIKFSKDFFGPEGKEWILKHAKRIIRLPMDKGHYPFPYDFNTLYKFEKFDNEERFKLWKPVADSDSKNGFSISTFSRSPSGFAQWRGILDNRLPEDGLTQRSGFVAVIGPRKVPEEVFNINPTWDWCEFNTVHIKYRGDGRRYNFIVNTGRYDNDIQGYDFYFYPLYTRGGPYWQTIDIPFNRLIFAAKGWIQNEQFKIPKHKVKFVGFNLLDTYDGPFCLEIAHIGLSFSGRPLSDDLLYEQYSFPHLKLKQIMPGCDPPDTE